VREDVEDYGVVHALSYLPRFVADGGSAPLELAPASKVEQETSMTAEDDFPGVTAKIDLDDIKEQSDNISVCPEAKRQTKNGFDSGAGDFEFRPLTEEEKQEFVNSLNARGKQTLAELAPKAKRFK
jgi:hypothetical protein